MERAPTVFNIVEFDKFQPLVLIHESGRGMFTKFASLLLFKADIKDGSKIKLFFDPKTNLPGTKTNGRNFTIKVEYLKNIFYFRSQAIVKDLKSRIDLKYYCAEVNMYPRVYYYRGEHILLWELYNASHRSINLEFKPGYSDKQMERPTIVKNELIKILKINEETYNAWVFETAYKFLEKHVFLNDWAARELTAYKLFWIWWQQQYYIEDEKLLKDFDSNDNLHSFEIADVRNFYTNSHINNLKQLDSRLYSYIQRKMQREFMPKSKK
jgi:hypothetical protein